MFGGMCRAAECWLDAVTFDDSMVLFTSESIFLFVVPEAPPSLFRIEQVFEPCPAKLHSLPGRIEIEMLGRVAETVIPRHISPGSKANDRDARQASNEK